MTSSFKYESLSRGSIRVLLLKPELKDGRPQLSIKTYERRNVPEYVSISYCWGQQSESEFVYLDDQPFPVRPNLFQLLLHLRHHCREYPEWRYFWVDAICIYQSNAQEKTEQVSQMENTYRNASMIAAWLGVPVGFEDTERIGRDHTSRLSSPAFVDEIIDSELMRSLESSEATDPRDRVFALIGLMEGKERKLLGTIFPDYTMSHEKAMLITMAYLKQVYTPRPFKWVVKPQQVWNNRIFRLDLETWQALWLETEGYETPHDLTNYTNFWNTKSVGRLLKIGQAKETFREQKLEVKDQRAKWFEARVEAL
ncbi:hypothetical protein Daesc_005592 [Daldinia eschscholtzii]|uniref:Heterokaryon incompatibility domain-containing protein n=1 Tax=Daldinia eschscholtzii TaxID=292717 RepID=A0AAX6MM80_9PEZI